MIYHYSLFSRNDIHNQTYVYAFFYGISVSSIRQIGTKLQCARGTFSIVKKSLKNNYYTRPDNGTGETCRYIWQK